VRDWQIWGWTAREGALEPSRSDVPPRPEEENIIESLATAVAAARLADDKKGVDIRVLELDRETAIADYFVIATGLSRPQVKAIQQEIHLRLKALGRSHSRLEGAEMGWWTLMDYGDVVVHVMQPEAREYYDLDGLYRSAGEVEWRTVEVPELAVARAHG
jgi:ribosome-associated protein